jgi:actin-related protein
MASYTENQISMQINVSFKITFSYKNFNYNLNKFYIYIIITFLTSLEKSQEYVDVNYKKYLKRYEEKKDKEDKKKKKEEEEKSKLKEKEKNDKSATVREITQEEFERRKAEEKLLEQKKNENVETQIDLNSPELNKTTSSTKEEKEEDKIAEGKVRPGPGNGGITDAYSWTQHDIKEINISIPIASNIRGKDVTVKYDAKEILVQIRGQDPILKGEWYAMIKPDSLLWSVEEVKNSKIISIYFEKFDNMKWWDCIIKGEQPIDTAKINPEPSKISDIEDPEMRAQIEKMMFDTRQKSMGLPTSEEQQKNGMLEQFKKAHPEMDFSKAKFG